MIIKSYECPYSVAHWKVVMMPTLSSLAAPEVVIMTTSDATSDDKVGIMITLSFQCCSSVGMNHWSRNFAAQRISYEFSFGIIHLWYVLNQNDMTWLIFHEHWVVYELLKHCRFMKE